MRIKTNIKAGAVKVPDDLRTNNNQTIAGGLKVKSNIKAGGLLEPPPGNNNSQTIARGLKVKSNVKAGLLPAV